jgi:hypothetical protein
MWLALRYNVRCEKSGSVWKTTTRTLHTYMGCVEKKTNWLQRNTEIYIEAGSKY